MRVSRSAGKVRVPSPQTYDATAAVYAVSGGPPFPRQRARPRKRITLVPPYLSRALAYPQDEELWSRGGPLPPLDMRRGSATLPALRMRLSTPDVSTRPPTSPLLELQLPQPSGLPRSVSAGFLNEQITRMSHGSSLGISGFTMERNLRLRELSQSLLSDDGGGAPGGGGGRVFMSSSYAREQDQRQRDATFSRALSEVTTLMDQKKARERDEDAGLLLAPPKKEAAATAAPANGEKPRSRKGAREKEGADEPKYRLTSNSPNERVLARLQQMRSDAEVRRRHCRRCRRHCRRNCRRNCRLPAHSPAPPRARRHTPPVPAAAAFAVTVAATTPPPRPLAAWRVQHGGPTRWGLAVAR